MSILLWARHIKFFYNCLRMISLINFKINYIHEYELRILFVLCTVDVIAFNFWCSRGDSPPVHLRPAECGAFCKPCRYCTYTEPWGRIGSSEIKQINISCICSRNRANGWGGRGCEKGAACVGAALCLPFVQPIMCTLSLAPSGIFTYMLLHQQTT